MIHGREILCWLVLLLVLISHALTGASFLTLVSYLFVSLTAALFFRMRIERQRREFVLQLKSHRKELRAGGSVVVDQLLLRYDTPLTSYQANIGGLLCSAAVPSNFAPQRGELHGIALFYSAVSLLSGWWSFSGPLFTVEALFKNLRGGIKTTVAELIDGPLFARRESERIAKERRRAAAAERKKPEVTTVESSTGPNSRSGKLLRERTVLGTSPSVHERAYALWKEEQNAFIRLLVTHLDPHKQQKTPPAQRLLKELRATFERRKADKEPKQRSKLPIATGVCQDARPVEKSARGS